MADLSSITLPNGTTYNLKDATARSSSGVTGVKGNSESSYRTGNVNLTAQNIGAYATGVSQIHRNPNNISADPQYTSLANSKNTIEYEFIKPIAGIGDWFYAAHLNSEYTITCNYSGRNGTKGNFAISTLFNPSAANTTLLDVSSIAETPFVLQIEKASNITATDVVHLELWGHTITGTTAALSDYKVELLTTGSTSPSGDYSWQTVYQRSNVSDKINGLSICLNPTNYSYLYFKGLRFTISGAIPGSTSESAWNYNCIDLSLFRLVDQRPAFSAARAVGALDLAGGTVFGQTTFLNGITGNLTGNASSATNASKVNNHTVNSDVPANAKFTDTIALGSMTGTLGLDHGGTGATSAAAARTNLGLGTAALASTAASVGNNSNLPTGAAVQSYVTGLGYLTSSSTLDATKLSGTVPTANLPSYVDDVLEYSAKSSFPSTGEAGKIYVDTSTNLTYRWSGSAYVQISPSLALGETSATAYRGDRGAAAYAHAVTNKGSAFSSNLYKITTNSEGHVTAASTLSRSDITSLDIDNSIPYGEVDSTSTATVFTATVPGITTLRDGVCVLLRNNVITSASGFTININNLGAKPAYNNMDTDDAPGRETTIFNKAYTMLFIYNSDLVEGGAWICYRGFNSNDNTIGYQLRGDSGKYILKDRMYRYRTLFSDPDGIHLIPCTTATSTNATAKRQVNTRPINPFGRIVQYGGTGSFAAGDTIDENVLWDQKTITLGYSFNRTGAALTLTNPAPVYIKCAPQSDGSAIIDTETPYVQTLPTSKDGKIYIFFGIAYSATAVDMLINHPVYYHDGTGIKLWTGKEVNDSSSPLGAYQTTIGDGTSTTYTINHNLNNDFILVSVSITENNVTYMAPLASVASPNQIGYSLTITDSNNIAITFTSAPGENAAKVSVVSTQAVAEAIDNLLLLTPDGEDYLKI